MATLTEAPLHLDHGGSVSRTYAVADWPAAAWWGFWQPLLRLRNGQGQPLRVRVAVVAAPHPTTFWSQEQTFRVRRLRAEAEAQRRAGAPWRANEMEASAAALEALKNREALEGAATFDAVATVTVMADNLAALEADSAAVVEWAGARGIRLATVPHTQLPAYMAGHPLAAPEAPAALPRRVLDDEALAALVPAQDGPWGGRGVYAGARVSDGAFVTLPLDDPGMAEGANLLLLGMTGSGKSFYAKALLTGMLLSGMRVIVFDVDGEFRSWCEAWGGVWVDHAPGSGRYVEPMRIARRAGGYAEMAERVLAVVSLLAGGLDALAENVVDKVTAAACQAAGVDPRTEETWGRTLRLRDWYATLAAMAGWGSPGRTPSDAPPGRKAKKAAAKTGGGQTAQKPTAPSSDARGRLEAAVLEAVLRDPRPGERILARALAAEGATPGRVHRILEHYGLLTAEARRSWAAAATEGETPGGGPDGVAATDTRSAGPEPDGADTPAAPSGAEAPSPLPPALLAAARDLAARLEPYFAGGLAHLFAAEDDVDFNAPLVVVHVADAGDAEARLGAVKMALDGAAVREVLENEGRSGRRYTAVYFEEGQRLLENPHARRFIAALFTAIRKRNGLAMLATNSTRALFAAEGGVAAAGDVWQNARGKVLLAMSREAVEDVRRHGKVPEEVVRLVEGLRPADHVAVLEWDGRYEVVRMDVAAEEAGMYRTRGLAAAGR
jgi:hypothetical protein